MYVPYLFTLDCTSLTSLPEGLSVGGGLFLDGCLNLDSVISVSDCGEHGRTVHVFKINNEVMVVAGCFYGTLSKFKEALGVKYSIDSPKYKEYLNKVLSAVAKDETTESATISSTLDTVEEILNIPSGTTVWHFNPFGAAESRQIQLKEMRIEGTDPKTGAVFYERGLFTFSHTFATNMIGSRVGGLKKTFLDKGEAVAFLEEYHRGEQYPEVTEHHQSVLAAFRGRY